jgi:hypothetical protein
VLGLSLEQEPSSSSTLIPSRVGSSWLHFIFGEASRLQHRETEVRGTQVARSSSQQSASLIGASWRLGQPKGLSLVKAAELQPSWQVSEAELTVDMVERL